MYDSVALTMLPLSSMGLDLTKDIFNVPMDLTIKPGPGVYHEVRTGDKFVLKTKDAEHLPLPNKELLELRFYLQRIVSMAGLGGYYSLDLHMLDGKPAMT